MEISQVQASALEARLIAARHSLFFYFRMGSGTWIEGFFSPWRGKANGFELYRDPGPGYGMLLHVIVIDSATGIVRGIRATVLSHAFSTAALAACHDILTRPQDDEAHMAEVAIQSRVPVEGAAERATIRFSTS